MSIAVIGSGGREHAILDKLYRDGNQDLRAIPGNAGTREIAYNVDIVPTNIDSITKFIVRNNVDLTIVGPDNAISLGLANELKKAGKDVFAPDREAAKIESSKIFGKQTMREAGVQTAGFEFFSDRQIALDALCHWTFPMVIKADGLALGKGVKICEDIEHARVALWDLMQAGKFGSAGETVLFEKFLRGSEVSLTAISDGENHLMFPSARDYKTLYDNGEGPMTGGMGAFSPVPGYEMSKVEELGEQFVAPILGALRGKGTPFEGVLYPGLIDVDYVGHKALEYNARFGDPEAQVLLARLQSSLLEIIEASIDGNLDKIKPVWSDKTVVCVVLASDGYPEKPIIGEKIDGLEEASNRENSRVLHAGTKRSNGNVLTNGGRVLNVLGFGNDAKEARTNAHNALFKIHFDGMQWRQDIAENI